MTKQEMEIKVAELQDWEELREEAKQQAETIKDMLKQELLERNTEELEVGKYIIRWTSCLSNRFDSTAFKKAYADLYKSFTKSISSRRFCVSC